MIDPHTLWAVAQLVPGEGIEDGVARIAALLAEDLDCRTCEHFYFGYCCLEYAGQTMCTNADRYDPLPPVRLWRDNVGAKLETTAAPK